MIASGFGTDSRVGGNSNNNNLPTFSVIKKNLPPQTTPHIPISPSHITNINGTPGQRTFSYARDDSVGVVSFSRMDGNEMIPNNNVNCVTPNGTSHKHSASPVVAPKAFSNNTSTIKIINEKKTLDAILLLIEKLRESVLNEMSDIDAIEESNAEADRTLKLLSKSQQEANKILSTYTDQLNEINEKHRIYTADQISESDNSTLEEVLEKLTLGLQSATVALYHSPKEKQKISVSKPSPKKSASQSLKSVESFKNLVPLGISPVTGDSAELCSQIIEKLQNLRATQIENFEKMKVQHLNAKESQRLTGIKINDYKDTIEKIKNYEKHLVEKKRLVEHLGGEGDYSNLNSNYLQDLCKIINKASRKIVTELALRDIRVANSKYNIPPGSSDKENCLVCFERKWNTTLSPCGHLLCNECSERLNFCPQCRAKIESRQKCFQP